LRKVESRFSADEGLDYYSNGIPSYSEYPSARFMFSKWRGQNALQFVVGLSGSVLTETLGSGAFQQVIYSHTDDDAFATGVDGKASNFDAMTTSNSLYQWGLANDLDQPFASIAVLVEIPDIA
jgi:hypothetical protein